MIVLSSDIAVKTLLDKRSGIYSDRQEMYIGQNLASGGLRLLMMVRSRAPTKVSVYADDRHRDTVISGVWYVAWDLLGNAV
jgi:hypothetical protein